MEYRRLGQTGLQVSALSFGSWVTFSDQIDEDLAYKCMKAAYDAGVNFFDNAEVYAQGNAEIMMGNIVKRAGWKRSDLVISTKIFWGGDGPNDTGLSRKHIIEGLDASLARLQMDYVDLLFCHRPDYKTPMEETVRAMNHLISQGKAFYWGTSEWSADQIMQAYHIARKEHLIPPVMEQPQYNMFCRQRVEVEYERLYKEIGLGTTIWSPLASGILTGKYAKVIPKNSRMSLEKYNWLAARIETDEGRQQRKTATELKVVAEELGCTLPQLAIAWCLKNPNVSSVITGASKVKQVNENMKAFDVVKSLDEELMLRLDKILGNVPPRPIEFR
jgi:voltage-dependent potassium channel beta subunit